MLEDSVTAIDSRFVIQALPWTGLDQQEEEEDDAAEEGTFNPLVNPEYTKCNNVCSFFAKPKAGSLASFKSLI